MIDGGFARYGNSNTARRFPRHLPPNATSEYASNNAPISLIRNVFQAGVELPDAPTLMLERPASVGGCSRWCSGACGASRELLVSRSQS